MYASNSYGLLVGSEFCLLEPATQLGDRCPDVVVQVGSVAAAAEKSFGSEASFKGSLPEIGQFWIQPDRIIVEPCPGVDEQVLSSCILGTAFSVLLQQRGFLVLHASAVIVDGSAIAFIGNPGAGKSTTASAFLRHGYPVITDDVLAIRLSEGQPRVIPSYPILKLLPDAVEALGHEAEGLPLLHATSHKRIQTFDCETLQESYPLQKIYLLAKGDRHEIQSLSLTEALLTLTQQSRAVKNLIDPSAKKLHFKQCAELANLQMTFRLRRRPGLESLSEIVGLVEDDLTHGKAPTHIPQVGIGDSPIHNA
ncbi:MAG: hypothetical protein MH252_01745 [Thermosynechococcaceae cyanobacterium MS004]|nr:hypothetical protein [Thermosynechococcaceae cyanobacterium MS004]